MNGKFQLKKIKLNDNGSVKLLEIYLINEVNGVESHDKWKLEDSARIVHDDLKEQLEKLAEHMTTMCDLGAINKCDQVQDLVTGDHADEFGKVFDAIKEKITEGIKVSGISLQGDTETGSVVITGKRKVHHTSQALVTPKMNFEGEIYGCETRVSTICDNIIEEVRLFFEENKGAMPEFEFENEEKEATDVAA